MLAQTTMSPKGEVKVHFQLDLEEIEDFVRTQLIEMKRDIEYLYDPNDVPVWDALNQVIAHVSTADQLKQMSFDDIDPDWINIVAEHS